jgi:hypothetical protein
MNCNSFKKKSLLKTFQTASEKKEKKIFENEKKIPTTPFINLQKLLPFSNSSNNHVRCANIWGVCYK